MRKSMQCPAMRESAHERVVGSHRVRWSSRGGKRNA